MNPDSPQRLEFSDVMAHLFYAVSTAGKVTVTTVFGDFTGRLQYPDGEGVKIAPDSAVADMAPGTPICVEYTDGGNTFRFYTEVASAQPNTVVAVLPYAVECSDRRLIRRIELPPDSGFAIRMVEFDAPSRAQLADVSVGGVSFADPTESGLRIGQVVQCELELPGEPPIPCAIEIRGVALRRGQLRVGGRIAAISIRERGHLARFLAAWESTHGDDAQAPSA